MKISYNWLKDYVNIDVNPEELSVLLTDIGLEVEGLEEYQSIKGGLEGIVIGEVITCKPHENADKLSITTVNIGSDELLPIVCGAPNVAAGQKVVVATVGTTLYDGDESFKIKKAKIRGEVSLGMICAEDELGMGISHDGIMVLDDDAVAGTNAADYFNIESDYIFEIGLTPNRSDAISHAGSARDVAAGLNQLKKSRKYNFTAPDTSDFVIDNNSLPIEVIVEDTEACPRYSGITFSDVKVQESPDWIKQRLESIGLRPINNIVDITNYVLHETGQPLHAFDIDEITDNKIIVKKLPEGTPFITLDKEERKLSADDLIICNSKEGMCIGGVFGGEKSGVTEKTTKVFLESAYFDSKHIRKTSKRHALQTDASFRYERGTDPNNTICALKRAAILIREIAGAKVSSEIIDIYPNEIEPWTVEVNFNNVNRLIGQEIDKTTVKRIITDLEMIITDEKDDVIKVLVPTFKVDVTREVDIIEEILRIYGYNNINISGRINTSISSRPYPDLEKIQNTVADYLVGQGFNEIWNNSLSKSEYTEINNDFNSKENVKLLNPLSRDLNIMRQTLLFGGLETLAYNINRKSAALKIFEFGNTYKLNADYQKEKGVANYHEEKHLMLLVTGKKGDMFWSDMNNMVSYNFVSGIVTSIIERLGIDISKLEVKENNPETMAFSLQYYSNNKKLAEIAMLSNDVLKQFDIAQDVYYADINWKLLIKLSNTYKLVYKPVSKFPSVKRDLSLTIDNTIRFTDLRDAAFKTEKKLLKKVSLFDVYQGKNMEEGKKSYALSFILQDELKTLTDKVIDKTMAKILRTYENDFNAKLR